MIPNRYATAPEGEPEAVLSDLRRKAAVAITRTARKERRRSGGEGSVYETAEGWRGALTWTDDEGARHRRVVRATTSQAARDKLDDLRRELKLGTLTPAGTGTVAEYLSEWLERERTRIRPSTWRELSLIQI